MKRGESVLDVCCGSGAQVWEYQQKGLIAQGLDNDPHMLGLARRYYIKRGVPSSCLVLGDAANLPFDDGSFDYTSVSMALHDKNRALADVIIDEMKRVTRSGGVLVFVDYSAPLPANMMGYLIRSIEFLAGRGHFGNFRCYLSDGGLNNLLARHNLNFKKEAALKNGSIVMLFAHNAPSI
jgi:ubiquinone/menaquinone biosynthesis C-methylase UbiE